ncbi:MAG: DUF4251 domain-containing protein [Bacteroidota bacterium]
MKLKIHGIFIVIIISILLTGCAALVEKIKERRQEREEEIAQGYEEMKELAFSGSYRFEANHVYPGSGYRTADVTGQNYFLSVHYYDVKAYLPFYGQQYMVDTRRTTGIKIDSKLENIMIEESDSRNRVLVRFTVPGEADNYLVSLDIGPSGNANLTISSSRRSTISYTGKVTPLKHEGEEEEEEKEQKKNNTPSCSVLLFLVSLK